MDDAARDAASAFLHNPDGAADDGSWSDRWFIELLDDDGDPVGEPIELPAASTPDPEGDAVRAVLAAAGVRAAGEWEAGEYGGAPAWEAPVARTR